ncbi:MAG: DNA internalization-related competence protein ComEC/Rec2 [Lysinibacillus sp.]
MYFEWRLIDDNNAPILPIELTWTEKYKINGDQLRGFTKTPEGTKLYVVYKIKSEEEKEMLLQQSLSGMRFVVTTGEWTDVRIEKRAHRFSFSMSTYLKGENAKGTLEITSWQSAGQKHSIATLLASYRYALNQHIVKTFPKSLAAEAQALIFGDQQHVDEDLNRAYQVLGITHLFAISGLHVALLSFMLYELLIRSKVRIQLAQLVIVIALPIYACLAGGAPSVWRAVLLVEIIFMVRMLKGKMGIDDALAIAFIMSLLWQPAMVLQIGFQLSYIACMSLIYGQRFLTACNYWWQQGFVMTLLCQLLAYPILLYHFYELSLSSFIANIVFVPLFSFIILPVNIVLLVLTLVSPLLAQPFFAWYEPARQVITDVIVQMQQLPYQLWIPGKPTIVVMVVLITTVICAFVLWEQGRKGMAILLVIVPALIFSLKHIGQNDLQISFVDVGQGDCIVIELPRRQAVYVIDSGGLLRFGERDWRTKSGQYEVGTEVVVPYLKGKGISSIDTFIFSHADADHVEGAEEVMQEIRVKEIHITPNSLQDDAMSDIREEAGKRQINIVEKVAGDDWELGNVSFTYIWPTDTAYEGNNDSLVLQLTYKQFRALFTGDLEEAGEQALVASGRIIPQTILKAGHHGSKTSSSEAFIQAAKPMVTIFMAGKKNRYNHPHPEILERFTKRGLYTLSTKENGTIEVRTNGEMLRLEHR